MIATPDERLRVAGDRRPHEPAAAAPQQPFGDGLLVDRLERLDQAHAVTRGSSLK